MLAAINPVNKDYFTDAYPLCHSQGELLHLIQKNNIQEIFIDPDLPGHLSLNTLICFLKNKYPDLAISVLEPTPKEDEQISALENNQLTPGYVLAGLILLIQLALSILFQYGTLVPKQILYLSLASLTAFLMFIGGHKWLYRLFAKISPQ